MKIAAVIMAGGAGTRLWPLSREEMPKQFHNITGEGSLLEETIKRLIPLNTGLFLVATARKYRDLSLEELKKCGIEGRVLAEPRPRNTAAAILYSSVLLSKIFDDSIMIVLPADHHISKKDVFLDVLKLAVKEAQKDNLVTLGIKPSYPETGYGYIKAVQKNGDILPVEKFVEKPDIETAKNYITEGNYFWNSGIFIWKTSVIMEHFKEFMPHHYSAFRHLMKYSATEIENDSDEIWKIKEEIFSSIDSISIDYGILEKAVKRSVIPCEIGWTDLGSWNSIDDILDPDENSNRTPAADNAIFVSSKNCSVFSEKKRIALVGVNNLVVVESGDSILVMDKNNNQEVRKVVDIIKNIK